MSIQDQLLNRLNEIEEEVKELIYSKDENGEYKYVSFTKIKDYDKILDDPDSGRVYYKSHLKNRAELMQNEVFFTYINLQKLISPIGDPNLLNEGFFIVDKTEITQLLTSNMQDKLLNKEDLKKEDKIPDKTYYHDYIDLNTRPLWTKTINLKQFKIGLEYMESSILIFFDENITRLVDLNNKIEFGKTIEFYEFYEVLKEFLIKNNTSHKRLIETRITEDNILDMIQEYTSLIT